MANASDVLLYGLVGGVIAYVVNLGGFKDFVDSRTQGAFGQPQPGGQNQFQQQGGSGQTIQKEQQDIISKLLNTKPAPHVTTPAPVSLTVAQKCGNAMPVCKSYADPCFCRCRTICRTYPGTHAAVSQDGSCRCIKDTTSSGSTPTGATSQGCGSPFLTCNQQKTVALCKQCDLTRRQYYASRCTTFCADKPGQPVVSLDGSCHCVGTANRAFAIAGNQALDDGLMQVPTLS